MAVITFDKVDYEVARTESWTWPEARLAKQVSGGMSIAQIEQGVAEADPDAVLAFVTVTVRRAWPEATPDHIRRRLDETGVSVAGLIAAMIDSAADEKITADPTQPAEAGTPSSDEKTDAGQ